MRLIVLDTNVVISARVNPAGAPARLVMDYVLEGSVQVVTCPQIVQEYLEVAAHPRFARYRFPPPWLDYLVESSLQLPDPACWPYALPDSGDAPFLALAHAAGAWLVTENLKHFPQKVRQGVSVVPPAAYLAQIENREL